MQRLLLRLTMLAALTVPAVATAGGYNRVYLVPALKPCLGDIPCQPREFQSAYTFDSIVLRSVPLKNGSNPKFPYKANSPVGIIVNGGGVEVYDPAGNLLAVTDSQSRP